MYAVNWMSSCVKLEGKCVNLAGSGIICDQKNRGYIGMKKGEYIYLCTYVAHEDCGHAHLEVGIVCLCVVCVCVHMCVCVCLLCVCMYVCMHVCMYACMRMYEYDWIHNVYTMK